VRYETCIIVKAIKSNTNYTYYQYVFIAIGVPVRLQAEATDSGIRKKLSKRHQVFIELTETENNYVGVLNTIMTVNIFFCNL